MAAMLYKTVSFVRERVQFQPPNSGPLMMAFNWREVPLAGPITAEFVIQQPLTAVADPGTLLTQTYGPQDWQIAGVVIDGGTTMTFPLQRPKT